MAKKKSAQQLKDEARKLLEQAKVAELEEAALLGRQLSDLAKRARKTPEEALKVLEQELAQLSTTYEIPKPGADGNPNIID